MCGKSISMLGDAIELMTAAGPLGIARAVIEIALLAYLAHQLIQVVRGTRAAGIVAGMGILFALYFATGWLGLTTVRGILGAAAPVAGFALIVIFQREIRAALLGIAAQFLPSLRKAGQELNQYEDVVFAVRHMKANGVGALIVIERETGLKTFVESGLALDAQLSMDLLVSIFLRRSPLHDGAVIIQGGRISAAACFLPLTTNTGLTASLGTRHRAAIGLTEESDAVAIVVSEESGRVSVAFGGAIQLGVSEDKLRLLMIRHIGPVVAPPEDSAEPIPPPAPADAPPIVPSVELQEVEEQPEDEKSVEGIGA